MEFDYVTLGRNVKKYRNIAGLTQVQLGEKAGYSETHISSIENGTGKPSISCISSIANSLGTGIDQLCYGELKNTDDFFLQELKRLTDKFEGKDKIMAIELTKAVTETLRNLLSNSS